MQNLAETITYRGHEIKIFDDSDPQSPDSWGNDDVFLVYDHRDFTIKVDDYDPTYIFEESFSKGKKTYDGYWIFPVLAYIHSGVSLSLSRAAYPFNDPWDTSFKGFMLVKKGKKGEGWSSQDKAREAAQALINEWNDFLSGNVYGYDTGNDSCWGYYGDYKTSGLIDDAKASIDSEISRERKRHFQRLKTWIKNRVPLYVRQPMGSDLAY